MMGDVVVADVIWVTFCKVGFLTVTYVGFTGGHFVWDVVKKRCTSATFQRMKTGSFGKGIHLFRAGMVKEVVCDGLFG